MDRQRQPSTARHGVPRRRVLAALLAAPLLVACQEEAAPPGDGSVILASPSAVLNPPLDYPTDLQLLSVEIDNGAFENDLYEAQVGAVRMIVTAVGGPYTLQIDPIVPATEIKASQATEVEFNTAVADEYLMRLSGNGASDTAMLNIRPPGGD